VATTAGSSFRFNKIPVQGFIPERGSVAPATPGDGQLWIDTSASPSRIRSYVAATTTWTALDGSFVAAGAVGTAQIQDNAVTDVKIAGPIAITKLSVDPLNRANHTGTQVAASISDLAATVQAYRLDQFAAPTTGLNVNGQKVTNLGAPTASSDAARLLDVQNAQAGIDAKPSVRAATTANITLSGLQTLDGVAVADGDRVLVKNQTTPAQNGLYLASVAAWTRTADTLTANTFVFVEEGTTQADTSWMITTNGAITVGTTSITFAQFGAGAQYTAGTGITLTGTVFSLTAPVTVALGGTGATTAAGAKTNLGFTTKFSQDVPALTAGVAQTITHNLNTSDVLVQFRDTTTGEEVLMSWKVTGVNTITVTADLAYAASALRCVVIG
jgi:hypothetical protein